MMWDIKYVTTANGYLKFTFCISLEATTPVTGQHEAVDSSKLVTCRHLLLSNTAATCPFGGYARFDGL